VNSIGGIPKSVHDFKNDAYSLPAVPGTSLTYVSDPMASDTVVLGTIRATLFVASTAPDTDLQVSIADVWPNGDVEYVQKGWLRASHRQLVAAGDVNYSASIYRPVHTHQLADLQPLVPGVPVEIDVEIPPVGQAFRQGHKIRVDIEMPSILPELWGFLPLPIPAVNLVYHDDIHPSSILMPMLSSVSVPPLPANAACGDRIRQPCRHPLP
jgi:predicted acyl esterase